MNDANGYEEALQSLLVVPREPELEPEPKVDLLSPPLPDHASLREGVENTNPDLVDLNTATPEEKRLMALMLGTLRVCPLRLREYII